MGGLLILVRSRSFSQHDNELIYSCATEHDNAWVFYIDVYGYVCQVKSRKGEWSPGSRQCFKAPGFDTPLAALVFPDKATTTNPEIHVFVLEIADDNTPSIRRWIKWQGGDVWEKHKDAVPTTKLSAKSKLAATSLKDNHLRVYWQDTDYHIRQSGSDKADGSDWAASSLILSDSPAFPGTPIAAAGVKGLHELLSSTVAWHTPSHTLEATRVNDGETKPLDTVFGSKVYDLSPSGSIAILGVNFLHTIIFYGGKDEDGIQRITRNATGAGTGAWKGPFKIFVGNITTATAPGDGNLACAAFDTATDNNGLAPGSVFYQAPGQVNIVEMRLR